jgi:catechol 2,3-dioxygenase-like lactoylglutathione lyase family enzyme
MLGHLGINVPDLVRAKSYYDELLPLVGFEPFLAAADEFAFRPSGGKPGTFLFFYLAVEDGPYSRHRVGLQHLAFMVKTRTTVHEVHQLVKRIGGEVLHEPQSFPQYAPPYFATFWLDPFGVMLEAVCHYDRD